MDEEPPLKMLVAALVILDDSPPMIVGPFESLREAPETGAILTAIADAGGEVVMAALVPWEGLTVGRFFRTAADAKRILGVSPTLRRKKDPGE